VAFSTVAWIKRSGSTNRPVVDPLRLIHPTKTANFTFWIFIELERTPFHTQAIEHQKTPVQRLAATRQHFNRFRRLRGADDADQRCEHTHHGAAGLFEFVIFGKQTVVARAGRMTHVEHRDLTVEAYARAGDQGLAIFHAGAIHRVARGEVVAAIEYHVGVGDALFQRFAGEPLGDGDDFDVGIDFQQGAARGNGFGDADGIVTVYDLPLQIGEVDDITIAQRQLADAASGEVKRRRRPKAAGADNQCMGLIEFFLAFYAELGQENVPAVA
jgi:hypothetical protein